MATAIQKLTDQIVNHIVIYNYTVQMRENVYMTMVHAIRDRTSGSFETLKEQGPAAYIVIFEEEYQEIGKQLFKRLAGIGHETLNLFGFRIFNTKNKT